MYLHVAAADEAADFLGKTTAAVMYAMVVFGAAAAKGLQRIIKLTWHFGRRTGTFVSGKVCKVLLECANWCERGENGGSVQHHADVPSRWSGVLNFRSRSVGRDGLARCESIVLAVSCWLLLDCCDDDDALTC